MIELATSLGIIFVTRLLVSKVQTFLPLYMNNKKNKDIATLQYQAKAKRNSNLSSDRSFSKCEDSMLLETYDPMVGTLNNYSEMIVQYGKSISIYISLSISNFLSSL
jgi:hypothetical protein